MVLWRPLLDTALLTALGEQEASLFQKSPFLRVIFKKDQIKKFSPFLGVIFKKDQVKKFKKKEIDIF